MREFASFLWLVVADIYNREMRKNLSQMEVAIEMAKVSRYAETMYEIRRV